MIKVNHVLELEDAAVKIAILKRIGPTAENEKLLAEAFEEAAKARDTMIEATFGKKAAAGFKKVLRKDL